MLGFDTNWLGCNETIEKYMAIAEMVTMCLWCIIAAGQDSYNLIRMFQLLLLSIHTHSQFHYLWAVALGKVMPWHLQNVRIGLWFALLRRAVYLSVNYRQHWLCGRSVLEMWLALAADPSLHSLSPSNSLLWLICSMTADICHRPSRPACLEQNPAHWGTPMWRCCAQSGTHHHCGTRHSPAGHGVWKRLRRHVLLTCPLVPQASMKGWREGEGTRAWWLKID